LNRKTGARALRAIIEGILMDVMYEIPSMLEARRVIVSKGVLESQRPPIILTEDDLRQAG